MYILNNKTTVILYFCSRSNIVTEVNVLLPNLGPTLMKGHFRVIWWNCRWSVNVTQSIILCVSERHICTLSNQWRLTWFPSLWLINVETSAMTPRQQQQLEPEPEPVFILRLCWSRGILSIIPLSTSSTWYTSECNYRPCLCCSDGNTDSCGWNTIRFQRHPPPSNTYQTHRSILVKTLF